MSFEAMAWASKQQTGSHARKLVLLMLANHSNGHTGQCNPSHKRMAEECEMSTSTVRKHITDMASMGFLTIVPKFVDGVQLPNQYILNIDPCRQTAEGMPVNGMGVCRQTAPNKQEKETINKPEDVCQEVWDEFLSSRKKIKAEVTALVMRRISSEAKIAGWTLEQALEEVCIRGWRSFKAEWVEKKKTFVEQRMSADQLAYEKMMGRA